MSLTSTLFVEGSRKNKLKSHRNYRNAKELVAKSVAVTVEGRLEMERRMVSPRSAGQKDRELVSVR